MPIEERNFRSILGEITAIILLVPFQTALFSAFVLNLARYAVESPGVLLFPESAPILITWGVLPIVYCIAASLYLHPKRIVSPIYAQIATTSAFSLMIIYAAFSTTNPTLTAIANLATNLSLLMITTIVIGMAQFFVVRWWVALNFDGMYRESFWSNGNFNIVMDILGDGFCTSWHVHKQKYNPESKSPMWIMRHRVDDAGNHVILAIGHLGDDENKCAIALTAFRQNNYAIFPSSQATQRLISMRNDIDERLGSKDVLLSLVPLTILDDPVSKVVKKLGEAPTVSRIEITRRILRQIPRSYKYAFIFTAIVLAIVTLVYMEKPFDFGTYIGIVVATVFSMVAEIGIPLRDELRSHKIEELD
jgi:multisubunit Na+/H+ antiporter MnhC subunit